MLTISTAGRLKIFGTTFVPPIRIDRHRRHDNRNGRWCLSFDSIDIAKFEFRAAVAAFRNSHFPSVGGRDLPDTR